MTRRLCHRRRHRLEVGGISFLPSVGRGIHHLRWANTSRSYRSSWPVPSQKRRSAASFWSETWSGRHPLPMVTRRAPLQRYSFSPNKRQVISYAQRRRRHRHTHVTPFRPQQGGWVAASFSPCLIPNPAATTSNSLPFSVLCLMQWKWRHWCRSGLPRSPASWGSMRLAVALSLVNACLSCDRLISMLLQTFLSFITVFYV